MSRIVRAAKLDASLYGEVKADKRALGQAVGIVVCSGLASGVGGAASGGIGILKMTILVLVIWYVWSFIAYIIGARLLAEDQTKTDHGELLRTVGFAFTPGLFRIMGIIPIPMIKGMVFFATTIWMLIALVIAVKQALDYKSTFRAVGVFLFSSIVQAIIFLFLSFVLGGAGKPV